MFWNLGRAYEDFLEGVAGVGGGCVIFLCTTTNLYSVYAVGVCALQVYHA